MKAWMALTGEDPLQLVRIREGAFGYADMNEGFLRLIVIDQGFEREFFQIADALLGRGGVFFDVGANYGLFSFGLAFKLGSQVEFHMFEPNKKVVAAIEMTRALYPGMRGTLNAVAVSEHVGFVSFKIVPEHTGVSHVVESGGDRVPAITLDSFFEKNDINSVTLLKIDVEGYELAVLNGAKSLLSSGAIEAIYFEFSQQYLGPRADELLKYLANLHYEVFFCREYDIALRAPASHTFRPDLPGHGVKLLPITDWQLPSMTDLLAVPKGRVIPIAQ